MSKLVRDKIPQIMQANGQTFIGHRAIPAHFVSLLNAKLSEEVAEYHAANGRDERLERLADIEEVLLALAADDGCTPGELEAIRLRKLVERGGFEERIVWHEHF